MKQSQSPPLGEIEHVPALVPPGRYLVQFLYWSTHSMFGRQGKLVLNCAIADQGRHFGVPLVRYYNCKVKGRTGRYGRFSVGWASDAVREYGRLIGLPSRKDRLSLTNYAALLLVADVESVKQSRNQEVLPPDLQYSVIRRLVAVEAGNAAKHP